MGQGLLYKQTYITLKNNLNDLLKNFNAYIPALSELILDLLVFNGHIYYPIEEYSKTSLKNIRTYLEKTNLSEPERTLYFLNEISASKFLLARCLGATKNILSAKLDPVTKLVFTPIKDKIGLNQEILRSTFLEWYYLLIGLKPHFTVNKFLDMKGLEAKYSLLFTKLITTIYCLNEDYFDEDIIQYYSADNNSFKSKLLERRHRKHNTSVRANMKKLMSQYQHQIMKLRQCVEVIFSVLKLRLKMESTLSRSPIGYFAHYCWALAAYQLKQFFKSFQLAIG